MIESFSIVGIGEILWDLLPEGKRLGGAPANFAYVARALGDNEIIMSRIGRDPAGKEIVQNLFSKGIWHGALQIDEDRETGSVEVDLENGQPSYVVREPAAWDFLESTDDWRRFAARADAVCFGTLAQRGPVSRKTIQEIVRLGKNLRIFDVNLRPPFVSTETVRASLDAANVVKLNHEELPAVAEMLGFDEPTPDAAAGRLLVDYDLKLICVTRGANGSLLVTRDEVSEHAGFETRVADPIGAGDAFTAALAHGLLREWDLNKINEFANRIGAFVASRSGATPEFPKDLLS